MHARRLWKLGCCAATLGAAACGGRSTSTGDGAGGANDLPSSGVYRETLSKKSDDCQRAASAGEAQDTVVDTTADGFNAALGLEQLRQDVPWQGLSQQLPHCDMAWTVEVTARSSTSIDLDVTEAWLSTDRCDWPAVAVPAAPCFAEWLQHFELEAACPANVETSTGSLGCH